MPNYVTRQWEPAPPLDRIPHLYFVDPSDGTDRDGQPVARRFPRRRLAASSRPSGRCSPATPASANWLLRQHGIDEYLQMPGALGRRTAAREIGVAQAEGFRQYLGHPFPHDNRLLALIDRPGGG